MSLNQTSENSSSFNASGSFSSNFKTVSSVNLTKENSYEQYNCNNVLSDKYFSFAYLPTREDREGGKIEEEDSCDCIERINELDRKYRKLFYDLTQQTKNDVAEIYQLKSDLRDECARCESLKQELDSMYSNCAKQREELDCLKRENEMLRLNYNNMDNDSFFDYQQYKNLDAMATLSHNHQRLAACNVNGSMPGYLNQYKNKSTDQLNMVNRHNSVVLSDMNGMHLNKFRDEHHSLHHLHPASATGARNGQNEEMCASAEDLCGGGSEKGQLETSDKKKVGLFSRFRSKLERRKTFKA